MWHKFEYESASQIFHFFHKNEAMWKSSYFL